MYHWPRAKSILHWAIIVSIHGIIRRSCIHITIKCLQHILHLSSLDSIWNFLINYMKVWIFTEKPQIIDPSFEGMTLWSREKDKLWLLIWGMVLHTKKGPEPGNWFHLHFQTMHKHFVPFHYFTRDAISQAIACLLNQVVKCEFFQTLHARCIDVFCSKV